MYVPNFIPEPLEVPANVTLDRYAVRLAFIRRVTLIHLIGVGIVSAASELPWPTTGLPYALVALGSLLIALDLLRIALRGQRREGHLSAACAPVLLVAVAWNVHELRVIGFPIVAVLAGVLFMGIYTVACGRDYSFVGGGLLSIIGSSVLIAIVGPHLGFDPHQIAVAMAANLTYLVYAFYDLASLMARRRRGEEIAAAVDLYRDVFNIFGYIPRVLGHWRKHRIWVR